MNKAYKFRIYPNAEQKIRIAKTFGCVRFIYNKMLADKISYYEATKQKLNNTPAQYKKEFEWLKEVDSLALANAQMNLQSAYNNFFRSPSIGFPKFKSKKCGRRSYTTYPHYYRQAEKKLAKEQRKLSLMKKGSNNRDKQRIKVAKLHEKVANQRKDFLHKQSRQITNAYDCVCIENLDMKAMSQSLNFGKSVSDNGLGMFTTFLKYKLEEVGKHLVEVDKFFASSQTCCVCGYKNTETKNLSVRAWECPNCKTHHDRDVNAAMNIRNEGMRILTA